MNKLIRFNRSMTILALTLTLGYCARPAYSTMVENPPKTIKPILKSMYVHQGQPYKVEKTYSSTRSFDKAFKVLKPRSLKTLPTSENFLTTWIERYDELGASGIKNWWLACPVWTLEVSF